MSKSRSEDLIDSVLEGKSVSEALGSVEVGSGYNTSTYMVGRAKVIEDACNIISERAYGICFQIKSGARSGTAQADLIICKDFLADIDKHLSFLKTEIAAEDAERLKK